MNIFCVVYYLSIDTSSIDSLRKKYDPYVNLIQPHITLVFPVPEEQVKEADFEAHCARIASQHSSFYVRMSQLTKSWDNWLFLEVNEDEGREEFINLHDELYTGILTPYLRKDLPYAPHIGLGLFNRPGSSYQVENPTQAEFDEEQFNIAKSEAEALGIDYRSTVDRISLIKVRVGEKGLEEVGSTKHFPLRDQGR